jgi:adenosylcobyric acid synthase
MNPVLVKPEGDTRSQVVVLGRPDLALSALPWRERGPHLRHAVESSLRDLQAEYELVVLEGAGSPAEINLRSSDLANMRSARLADARVLIVADIDRGGAFAHLYGTWRLLERRDRRRIRGFVLNKFRGDASLLPPAPQILRRRTGVPTLGVVPWLEHELPDEDGAAEPHVSGERPRVAVVRYPTASNLDEYRPLERVADVVWARSPSQLEGAALVVLPGSKHVAADRAWLRDRGLDEVVRARAAAGGRILAVCGGLQMAGDGFVDAAGVDGSGPGLGLLPLRTTFEREKAVSSVQTTFAELPAPWSELSGVSVDGYEIRHGLSSARPGTAEALPSARGWVAGSVLGVYVHGLFENPPFVRALLGAGTSRSLDETFDALADALDAHVDMRAVAALAGAA